MLISRHPFQRDEYQHASKLATNAPQNPTVTNAPTRIRDSTQGLFTPPVCFQPICVTADSAAKIEFLKEPPGRLLPPQAEHRGNAPILPHKLVTYLTKTLIIFTTLRFILQAPLLREVAQQEMIFFSCPSATLPHRIAICNQLLLIRLGASNPAGVVFLSLPASPLLSQPFRFRSGSFSLPVRFRSDGLFVSDSTSLAATL